MNSHNLFLSRNNIGASSLLKIGKELFASGEEVINASSGPFMFLMSLVFGSKVLFFI